MADTKDEYAEAYEKDLLADVADMIADWFGRSEIDADRELAARIVARVREDST